MLGGLVVHGAVQLCAPGCWKVRRPLGVAEEEAEEEAGGRPGLSSERGENAGGEASCCGGGMSLLELFDAQSVTRKVMIVAE